MCFRQHNQGRRRRQKTLKNLKKQIKKLQVQWQSPEVVGKWCVLTYDGDLYPGVITDTSETHVEVRCMQKIGVNRFFWPAREDILWYQFEDIVCIIPPPRPVTGRHMEIEKEVWAKLEKAS